MTRDSPDTETEGVGQRAATVEAIQTSYQLWANESVVKTEKLTLFFIAQSVLLTGFALGNDFGQVLIAVIGVAFSALMYVSMGRTDAYQTIWKRRAEALAADAAEPIEDRFDLYPESEEIGEMPWYKQTSQAYIHYPPLAGVVVWLCLAGLFVSSTVP